MLDDMCDVVDMEKKLTGSENQVGGFDLIYNNGPVQKVRPVGNSNLPPCSYSFDHIPGVPSLLGCSFDRKSAKKANAQVRILFFIEFRTIMATQKAKEKWAEPTHTAMIMYFFQETSNTVPSVGGCKLEKPNAMLCEISLASFRWDERWI